MAAPEPNQYFPADSEFDQTNRAASSPNNPGLIVPFAFGAVVGAMMAGLLAWGVFELTAPPPPQPLPRAMLEELGIKEPADPTPPPDRPLWHWVLTGAGFGAILGSIVATVKWARGQPTDIGTAVGLVIGLIPAAAMLTLALRFEGGGKTVIYGIVAAIFVGPMAGMLLGGIADGIYDRVLVPPKKEPPA